MKHLRHAAALLALFALLGAGAPTRVPQAQIEAENAHWKSLGVHLPKGGIVLPDPYSAPYSNRSFVVPYAWYRQFYATLRKHHGDTVNAAALREDLPTLRLLMEKTYAGWSTAQKRGWNWNRWFGAWNASLAKDGNRELSLQQAFAPWGKLEQFQLDNHSGIAGFQGFTSGSVSAVLAQKPAGACTSMELSGGRRMALAVHDAGQQPHAVQQWNGAQFSPAWYVSYPRRDGDAVALTCGGKRVAVHRIPDAAAPAQKPEYQSWGGGIAYLRMPTFTDANDDALHAALSKAQGLGKERVLIVDLRGNDGGNAPLGVLTNWFAESAIEQAEQPATQFGTQSCFRTALFFGLQQQLAAGLKPPASASLTQFLQQLVDPLAAPSNCTVEPVVTRGESSLLNHQFSPAPTPAGETRVIALVDNGCGSDCEFMTYVLAGLPDTVIVGQSTYGVMGFTQPGYFVLPHTRIPFRLALSRTDQYGDGRSVDGYGITVDVLLTNARAAGRASLLALAKKLSD